MVVITYLLSDLQTNPNINNDHKFLFQYLGKWYEQEKYPQIFQVGGRCTTAEYSLNDDGTVHVLNTEQIM